jgi:glycosyltransferase involved in cell wall biosynthesis
LYDDYFLIRCRCSSVNRGIFTNVAADVDFSLFTNFNKMINPVLTIFYQFNPWQSTIGGIQTIISYFIKYAPQEFELQLVGTGADPNLAVGQWHECEFAGKAVRFMPLFNLQDDNVRKIIPTTVKYTAALLGRQFASDFMHFHRLEPTWVARHWSGDKTFFVHNDIQQQMAAPDSKDAILWRHLPQAYFAMEKLLVQQFTQILSCNSESAALYQQRYPTIADRVALIKNAVDEAVFYPLLPDQRIVQRQALAQRLNLPADTQFMLFAGRLHPQKDPLLLIRSLAALADPKVHLLIAGDGELAQATRNEIAQLGLTRQVTMLGSVKPADLADLHRLASLVVLTSAYEGLPLVVLEALACGTPIVTTHCGETPKFLTENSGVVCEERTPAAIAMALRQVLEHPEQYPIAACTQVAAPHSARQIVGDVYNSMLARWRPCLPV